MVVRVADDDDDSIQPHDYHDDYNDARRNQKEDEAPAQIRKKMKYQRNKWTLLQKLAEMKTNQPTRSDDGSNTGKDDDSFLLVINHDIEMAIEAISQNIALDGIHVKERDGHLIPSIRERWMYARAKNEIMTSNNGDCIHDFVIRTSCHSIESAMESYNISLRHYHHPTNQQGDEPT